MTIKLHLGCGKLRLDNYLNVDITSEVADIKCSIDNLNIFNDNTIDEIYVSHALEHFSRREVLNVLLEWNRILKVGGTLRVAVPDFEKVVKMYNHVNLHDLLGFLNGGQRDKYDIHYANYDFNCLKELLNTTGFVNVERYDAFEFLGDKDDYSKCYMPHMDFQNGEHMSLNVVCNKMSNTRKDHLILSDNVKKFTKIL